VPVKDFPCKSLPGFSKRITVVFVILSYLRETKGADSGSLWGVDCALHEKRYIL